MSTRFPPIRLLSHHIPSSGTPRAVVTMVTASVLGKWLHQQWDQPTAEHLLEEDVGQVRRERPAVVGMVLRGQLREGQPWARSQGQHSQLPTQSWVSPEGLGAQVRPQVLRSHACEGASRLYHCSSDPALLALVLHQVPPADPRVCGLRGRVTPGPGPGDAGSSKTSLLPAAGLLLSAPASACAGPRFPRGSACREVPRLEGTAPLAAGKAQSGLPGALGSGRNALPFPGLFSS